MRSLYERYELTKEESSSVSKELKFFILECDAARARELGSSRISCALGV